MPIPCEDLKVIEEDCGFDFETSSDVNDATAYEDLPIYKSMDSTISDEELASTCSTMSAMSDDEVDSDDHDQAEPEAEEEYSSRGAPESTKSCMNELQSPPRTRVVRFSACLVTEVRTRPRTTDEDWHQCYYSVHELQR